MPLDDWAKIRNEKKNSGSEFSKIKRDKEIEKEMKALGLNKEEYKEFLERRNTYQPSLYAVNRILDDLIVAEFTSRMSTFTAFILAQQNVYLSGLSGSGKTKILDACVSLVMPNDICKIDGGSDKNLLERVADIERCKWLIISEINKIDNNAVTIEYLKSAAEHKSYNYDRGGLKPIHIEIPWRSWTITRADESANTNPLGIEMLSRVIEIVTDSSENQTRNILDRKAENYQYPFRKNKIDMVEKSCLRWHLSTLPEFDICVNPAAETLTEIMPTIFVSARRRFDNYAAVCQSIAKFNWKNRLIGEIDGQSVLFVTAEDVYAAHICFGQHLIDAALQVSDLQKIIMKIIIENGMSSKQDVQQALRHYSLNLPIKTIDTHVSHLADLGYLNVEKQSRENIYSATDFYKKFELKPDMQKVVECAKNTMLNDPLYRPYADEYIARFCDPNNMDVLNPFTGVWDNMLTYDFGSTFDVDEGTRMKNVEKNVEKEQVNNKNDLSKWV